MKRTISFMSFLAMLSLSSCTKSTPDCNLVPAKIIRYDCDRVIFQLLTSETIGDASWTDLHSGQTYTNVVSYYNTCQIAALTNGRKDTLYVKAEKTSENLVAANCVQCAALAQNPPQTKVVFTQLETEDCQNDK